MTSIPFISVVICTYKRPLILQECLNALQHQDLSREHYEIIVSDDNNDSETKSLLQAHFPEVKWVKGPERGFSANRNNGSKYAKGQWLVFTDDDCIPSKNWLRAIYNGIQSYKQYLVFEGKTLADREKRRFDEESPINETGGKLWGCNIIINKEYFFKIGGMCEKFNLYMEDIEFKTRILKTNQKIIFLPDAIIIHPWRKSRSILKLYKASKNVDIFLQLHPEQKDNFRFNKLIKIAAHKFISNLQQTWKFKFNGFPYMLGQTVFNFYNAFRMIGK